MSNKGCILFKDARERSRVLNNERLFEGFIGHSVGSMVYFVRGEVVENCSNKLYKMFKRNIQYKKSKINNLFHNLANQPALINKIGVHFNSVIGYIENGSQF